MKSLSRTPSAVFYIAFNLLACVAASGCEQQPAKSAASQQPPPKALADYTIESPADVKHPPFAFDAADDAFLDSVEKGSFQYFWDQAQKKTLMVPDRSSNTVISMAGVGFQLASLCIGVERHWITRSQGEERAAFILRTLAGRTDIRKNGLFYHFLDGETAGQPTEESKPPERIVSTIDSAILFSGILTASKYFGGEVATIGDKFFDEADWASFVVTEGGEPHSSGYISLGWKPDDVAKPTGDGKLLPYAWIDSGDEHKLVTFLAVAASKPEHRISPDRYYRLRRQVGQFGDTGPLIWFPWSGALFVSTFAHCWLDYAGMGPDDPAAFGVKSRPRVDWWENARRTTRLHQLKCAQNPLKLPTLSEQAWGLTASDKKDGYLVAGVFPTAIPVSGAIPQVDYPVFLPKDEWGDGTIAPYGAGSAIMFDPKASIAAMRYYVSLKNAKGEPLVWRDPAMGGHGFRDAFNLGTGWVGPDDLAIDHGPLIVAIENARTGLIWKTFASHPAVVSGLERLRLKINR